MRHLTEEEEEEKKEEEKEEEEEQEEELDAVQAADFYERIKQSLVDVLINWPC